jgi:hypothetical protein
VTKAVRRSNRLGRILGIGLGLLLYSALLFWGGEGTVWATALSLGLLLIVPVVLGSRLGSAAADRGMFPTLNAHRIAVAALIIWPACALLPLGIGVLRLQSGLSEIPVYPNSRLVERNVTIFATDGLPPSVELEFETTDGAGKVLGFYDRELAHRGWILIGDEDRSRIQFAKEDRIGLVRGCEVGPGANRFEITYFIVHKSLETAPILFAFDSKIKPTACVLNRSCPIPLRPRFTVLPWPMSLISSRPRIDHLQSRQSCLCLDKGYSRIII